MGVYRSERQEPEKAPSVRIDLPVGFKRLEVPLNALILKLDGAEEREQRIESLLRKVAAELGVPVE